LENKERKSSRKAVKERSYEEFIDREYPGLGSVAQL
jgi:hypothetical protein